MSIIWEIDKISIYFATGYIKLLFNYSCYGHHYPFSTEKTCLQDSNPEVFTSESLEYIEEAFS